MSWEEPSSLAEYSLEQQLIDQLRAEPKALPDILPKLDLGEFVYPAEAHINEIHRMHGFDLQKGLELHPLLTPGPADISFVMAHRRGYLSDVLSALGHWEFPTVAFVLRGRLIAERIFEFKGNTMKQRAWAEAMNLTVIPASSKQPVIIERDSVLLLSSPGQINGFASVFAERYLEPLRLRSIGTNLRPLIHGKELAGNTVRLRRHRPVDRVKADYRGLLSIGIHVRGEHLEHAPDLCVVGPGVEVETQFSRHTLEIALT